MIVGSAGFREWIPEAAYGDSLGPRSNVEREETP
ncbi:hypothetical protein ABIC53_002096 [Microbacterium sp. 1262]